MYLRIMMKIERIGKQGCKTILVICFFDSYIEIPTIWQQKIR